MNICVIGLGYIGLPTALMLASNGVNVTAVDINEKLITNLQSGNLESNEKGLSELYKSALPNTVFQTECAASDMYIIAVPTPYMKDSKKVDSSYIIAATESVISACRDNAIVIIESTVSPGTIDRFIRPLISKSKKKINLAHAPERVIPGNLIYELMNNSRTIGVDAPDVGEAIRMMYSTFCKGDIIITDIRTAEMTKVVENTYRDINIAYANELAKICRSDGMDVYEIIRIANKHPRVNILSPGPGVGGHCISVDPWFLVGEYPELTKLIKTAREVNNSMPEYVYGRIRSIMADNSIRSLERVGLYGLTYKENVDDTRESPTLQLLDMLKRIGEDGLVHVYDPYVKKHITQNQHDSLESFLNAAEMVVILVSHNEIKENEHMLSKKVVLDTKNILNLRDVYKL